jgi:hypothetical protein
LKLGLHQDTPQQVGETLRGGSSRLPGVFESLLGKLAFRFEWFAAQGVKEDAIHNL